MASRAELRGRVTLNTKAYQGALRRMRRNLRKWGRTAARMGRMAAKGMAVVTGVAVAVGAAITKLTKQTADAGDRFHKMALRTGQSVRALEEYDFIAQRTGTTAEDIQKATRRMSRAIAGARDGLGTYTREFDRLGISMRELEGIGVEEAFDRVTAAIGDMDDEVQQAATATQLFSSTAGQKLLPMLKSGGEGMREMRDRLREIGFTFDHQGADKAAKFNDKLTDLRTAIAGVRNKMVLAFIDHFSDGIETLIQKIVEFRKQGKFAEWAATAAGFVNNFVENSRKLLSGLFIAMENWWERAKLHAQIAWDAAVVATKGAALAISKIINGFVVAAKTGWIGLRTTGQVAWNLLKEAAAIAFNGMQLLAIKAFRNIMAYSESSINKIIAGLNKIPHVDIDPVDFDSIDKAESKIDELEGKIRDSVDAMKISGDAWEPIEKGADEVERAKKEAAAINKELDQRFEDVWKERGDRLEENLKKAASIKDIEESIMEAMQKNSRISEQHAKIREQISKWQNEAYKKERERAEALRDGKDELAGQNDELGKQVDLSKRTMMGQALRRMGGGGEPQSQLVRQREGRSALDQKKLAKEQIKIQKRIAENTARGDTATAW